MRPLPIVAGLCAAALAFPAGAAAVVCAPPGTSGVDQYFETIPGASCNLAPPGLGGPGGPAGHGGRLPPGASRQLVAEGPAGRAVAQLVAGTGPPSAVASGRRSAKPGRHGTHGEAGRTVGSQTASGVTSLSSGGGEGPIAGVLSPILSGAPGGTGPLLAIFLGGVLLVGVGVAVLRRRRG